MTGQWNAKLYDDKHSFVWKLASSLVELLAAQPEERVLDLGCGTGQLTDQLAQSGANVIGLDNSPAMIEEARRLFPKLTFQLGDAHDFEVTQQVDAIRALGTSPIKKIVIPRVLACLIALPLLTVFANAIGVMGGLVVGTLDLGLDPNFYLQKMRSSIQLADYFSGFGKTIFFSFFVSLPSCYFGLNTTKGTRGVGGATTKAVVVSCILILIGDYFLTKLFWIFESWK